MIQKFKDSFHTEILPLSNLAKQPLWSVVIPTYNCAKYLEQTLVSVLKQYLGEQLMEIIVVDDCSTKDDPKNIVAKFKEPITFFKQPKNVGKSSNYATGLKMSTGKYIHLLHGDDTIESGFYKIIGNLFDKFPDASVAFCHCKYVNEDNVVIGQTELLSNCDGILENFEKTITVWQQIQPPSIVMKREVYETLGGYDKRLKFIEDWEFYVRTSQYFKFVYTPKSLANYRVFEANSSSKSIKGGKRVATIFQVFDIMDAYLPPDLLSSIRNKRNQAVSIYLLNYIPYLVSKHDIKGFAVVSKALLKFNRNFKLWARYLRFIVQYKKFLK